MPTLRPENQVFLVAWVVPKIGIIFEYMFRDFGVHEINDVDRLADAKVHRQA
jgi:hypothetical protein